MRPFRAGGARGGAGMGGAVVLLLLAGVEPSAAARIADLTETEWLTQAARFFSFSDPTLRPALAGTILLGICCGVMGVFLVTRKLALMGDALSHAVLPGVAMGFLWNMTKDPLAIFVGATVAGLLGAGTVQLLRQTTKHKEDAALGFVLASFFGVGICLFTMIQNLPGGSKSGLDKFLFGQAAAMDVGDVWLLGVVTVGTLGLVTIFFKELRATSFDPGFARAAGLPVRVFHYGLMLLLAFAIVSALQAVGVVLVSAMLVIPAAAAVLLTDRLGWMLVFSAVLGALSGATGAFFSFVGRNLPTGPFMVLAAGLVFALALFFAPRHGIATRWWGWRSRRARVRRENALKAMYHVVEEEGFRREVLSREELARRRRLPLEEIDAQVEELAGAGLVTTFQDGLSFTPQGWQRACEIVRNHRLWELYLTNAAQLAPDHVHEDAEKIEHLLGEETVRQLERRLNFARRDPHGKLIPGLEDIRQGPVAGGGGGRAVGFGGAEGGFRG